MRRSQPWQTNRARVLRANDTSAEAKLWSHLRNRNLGGFKFVRQAPVGAHFVDFLCREKCLVVEVDGATHMSDSEIENDRIRSAQLSALGYVIMRVSNEDVFSNIGGVLGEILARLDERAG